MLLCVSTSNIFSRTTSNLTYLQSQDWVIEVHISRESISHVFNDPEPLATPRWGRGRCLSQCGSPEQVCSTPLIKQPWGPTTRVSGSEESLPVIRSVTRGTYGLQLEWEVTAWSVRALLLIKTTAGFTSSSRKQQPFIASLGALLSPRMLVGLHCWVGRLPQETVHSRA